MTSTSNRPTGFTLIEGLVVIGVVGILVSLILPAVQSIRESAARASCQNNLKQIGIALQNYESIHGRLPPDPVFPKQVVPRLPDSLVSWMALILPFVEQDSLWNATVSACLIEPNPRRYPPHLGYITPVKLYACPSDSPRLLEPGILLNGQTAAFTSYLGIAGSFVGPAVIVGNGGKTITAAPGMFGERPGVRLAQVTDGTSQTVAVGERPPPTSFQAGIWYTSLVIYPDTGPDEYIRYGQPWMTGDRCSAAGTHFGPGRLENPCDRNHLWSLHRGGANFLFADGSARFMSYSADSILPLLCTRSGGELIESP